jgi:hypothetical protein
MMQGDKDVLLATRSREAEAGIIRPLHSAESRTHTPDSQSGWFQAGVSSLFSFDTIKQIAWLFGQSAVAKGVACAC